MVAERISVTPPANVNLRFTLLHLCAILVDHQWVNRHRSQNMVDDLFRLCIHELSARNRINLCTNGALVGSQHHVQVSFGKQVVFSSHARC